MDINVLDPRETLDYLLEGNTLTPEHLDRFLQANPEEGQYLDYKDGIVTTQQERANGRKIVREYINGFANSDGGVLIIGVGRSKPREIKPCTSPGSEPLDKWAENCVHEMAPFFLSTATFSGCQSFQRVGLGYRCSACPFVGVLWAEKVFPPYQSDDTRSP